jgi:asparagine synthetase B (glutamine-hydrolysing)
MQCLKTDETGRYMNVLLGTTGFSSRVRASVIETAIERGKRIELEPSGKLVNESISMLTLKRRVSEPCTRIAENDAAVFGYTGHVVANALPLCPDADSLLDRLIPNAGAAIESLDGLYAMALYRKQEGELILGTDRYGFSPLYLLHTRDGLIFSSSMDLVIRCAPVDLHINTEAVSEFLQIQYCLQGKTFVSEIQRMPQGCIVTYDARQRSLKSRPYFEYRRQPVPETVVTDEVVSGLAAEIGRGALRRVEENREHLCLLGGGRDSRSIAGVLAHAGVEFSTLTTDPDNGALFDPDLALEVARTLKVENTFVPLPSDYVERTWRDKCEAADFSTAFHTWIMHLAASGGHDGAVAFDGLIGDVMLKPHMLDANRLDLLKNGRLRALADELATFMLAGRTPSNFLRPRVAEHWKEGLTSTVRREIKEYDGHPNTVSFFWLQHRSRRAIASSPCSMLNRRWLVVTPFTDPSVFHLAMGIPPQTKLGGNVNTRIIGAIDPRLATIPLGSDTVWPSGFKRRPRTRLSIQSPGALSSYLEVIDQESEIISSILNPKWMAGARTRLDAGPVERWEYLRDAGIMAEFCYWVQTYRGKVNIDAIDRPC